jgi:hypothetical protein
MTIAKKATSPSAKSPQRGNLKPKEIQPLIMAARAAYNRQSECGLVDNGETFDTWRHRQCMDAVGRPGITACHHADYRPLLAHFQTLSGDDATAFGNLLKSGKPTDHAAPGDTHESRRILAHQIAQAVEAHTQLAAADPASLSPHEAARQAAIAAKGKGPISVGYVVYLVRQKTRRPDLTLGKDWQAGLADRCTTAQLTQIRATIINRIAAVEGTGTPSGRNKTQRSPRAKQSRDPRTLDPRPGFDLL